MLVVSICFVLFIHHTLKAGPWKYCLTLNRSVAQKRLGTADVAHASVQFIRSYRPPAPTRLMASFLFTDELCQGETSTSSGVRHFHSDFFLKHYKNRTEEKNASITRIGDTLKTVASQIQALLYLWPVNWTNSTRTNVSRRVERLEKNKITL